MLYYEFLILFVIIILIIIYTLINSRKKVPPQKAFVIERFGKFDRIVEDGVISLTPIIERIRYVVNLEKTEQRNPSNVVILSDGKKIQFTNTLYFHVIDIEKAAYTTENLTAKLMYLDFTLFREIAERFSLSDIKSSIEVIKDEFILKMNLELYEIGLKLDDVDIQTDLNHNKTDSNNLQDIENLEYTFNKAQVITKYKSYNDFSSLTALRVIIFLLILVYIVLIYDKLLPDYYLLLELIKLIFKDCFIFIICLFISTLLSIYINLNKIAIFILSFIILLISNIITTPSGTHLNMLNYTTSIFKDIISSETSTETVNTDHISVYDSRLYDEPAYVSYKINNSKFYRSKETDDLVKILDKIDNLKIEISIEYHNNSKIIKSIDGINKFNYNELEKRINYLIEQKEIAEKQKRKIRQEQLNQINQQSLNDIAIYNIKRNSIEKNIEDVKNELQKYGITDCPIKYISSKLYSTGTVAFAEKEGADLTNLYVVNNNDIEELTPMPQLTKGMSKDEVIKILEQNELTYDIKIRERKNNQSPGLYLYSPPGFGTYVPKGSMFIVSIYE